MLFPKKELLLKLVLSIEYLVFRLRSKMQY